MEVGGTLLRMRQIVVRSGSRDDKGAEVWEGLGAAGQGLEMLSDMQVSLTAAIKVRVCLYYDRLEQPVSEDHHAWL